MRKILSFLSLFLVAFLSCALLISENVSAFSPTQSLRARYSFFLSHNSNINMIYNTGDASDPNNYTVLNDLNVTFDSAYIEDGEIVDLTLVLTNKSLNNSADINFTISDVRCNDWGINCMLLGFDGENVDASMAIVHIYIQVNQTSSAFRNIHIYFNPIKSTLYGQETLTAQNIVFYHQTGYDLSSGFSSLHTDLQAINSALSTQTTYLSSLLSNSYENFNFYGGFNIRLNTIIDSLSNLNTALSTTNANTQRMYQAQEQANDDANDRYQDEKDTMQDNADDATGSWSDVDFELNISDPFTWIWSLGSSDGCVQVPLLASLLHANSDVYCSWWNTTIRSIVSPVVNIFVLCISFGFFMSWLKKGGM